MSKKGYTAQSSTITAYGYGVSISFQVTGSTCDFTCNWAIGGDTYNANDVDGLSEDFIVPISSPVKMYFQ